MSVNRCGRSERVFKGEPCAGSLPQTCLPYFQTWSSKPADFQSLVMWILCNLYLIWWHCSCWLAPIHVATLGDREAEWLSFPPRHNTHVRVDFIMLGLLWLLLSMLPTMPTWCRCHLVLFRCWLDGFLDGLAAFHVVDVVCLVLAVLLLCHVVMQLSNVMLVSLKNSRGCQSLRLMLLISVSRIFL